MNLRRHQRKLVCKKSRLKVLLFVIVLFAMSIFASSMANAATTYNAKSLGDYIVVPVAEGGIKCFLKKDYKEFCIMPPGYNIRAQVFKRGEGGSSFKLVTSGIKVEYSIENNTYSQNGSVPKTNFWKYAPDFGWSLATDKGLTGYGLSGTMVLNSEGNAFEATGVPQMPYLDGTDTNRTPYQNGIITVKDATTGAVLATQKFVMPASDEQRCYECHGGSGGADTDKAILKQHDIEFRTTLAADGKSNLCADCHADPYLDKGGRAGIPYLSIAMHKLHGKEFKEINAQKYSPVCNYCHPGETTKCNRGVMAAKGYKCDNSGCHGSLANMGSSSRIPWSASSLPKCTNCHSAIYSENTGKKYKDSILVKSPISAMNGKIWCQTCHGAQHEEWPSTLSADNQVPVALQGSSKPLGNSTCGVCHVTGGKITEKGKVHTQAVTPPAPQPAPATEDKTAPVAPTKLKVKTNKKMVHLVWHPNKECDLAGYNVYRTSCEITKPQGSPLNKKLLRCVQFQDRTAQPGACYNYFVVAVDKAGNVSTPAIATHITLGKVKKTKCKIRTNSFKTKTVIKANDRYVVYKKINKASKNYVFPENVYNTEEYCKINIYNFDHDKDNSNNWKNQKHSNNKNKSKNKNN